MSFFETFADANAGVETAGYDVAQSVIDYDVEHDIRMGTMKPAEPRCDELLGRHPWRVDTQRSSRPTSCRCGLRYGGVHLPRHRRNAVIKASARGRWRHAARGAIEQTHAEACFELPDRLA